MTSPPHDPAAIARAALAEMPEAERDALLTELLCQSGSLSALVHARNAITDRAADLIADQYAETIIRENRFECAY